MLPILYTCRSNIIKCICKTILVYTALQRRSNKNNNNNNKSCTYVLRVRPSDHQPDQPRF